MNVQKQIEVRYAETDQMGVVYHANYVVWMEIGRTSFIEALGYKYAEFEESGVVSPVLDIQVQYKQPVKYGETAVIETSLLEHNGIRTVYQYTVYKENGEVAVTATSSHVYVKKETFRPTSVRKLFPDWHEAYLKALPKGEESDV